MIVTIYAIMNKDLKNKGFYIGCTKVTLKSAIKQLNRHINETHKYGMYFEIKNEGGLDSFNVIELAKVEVDSKDDIIDVMHYYEMVVNEFYDIYDKIACQN